MMIMMLRRYTVSEEAWLYLPIHPIRVMAGLTSCCDGMDIVVAK